MIHGVPSCSTVFHDDPREIPQRGRIKISFYFLSLILQKAMNSVYVQESFFEFALSLIYEEKDLFSPEVPYRLDIHFVNLL